MSFAVVLGLGAWAGGELKNLREEHFQGEVLGSRRE